MAPIEPLSVTVSRRRRLPFVRRDRPRVVVWLRGEHDLATADALSEALAQAVAVRDADVVVDVSDVQFMGAATVEILARAREDLQFWSRAFVLRSPPKCVRRVIELCDYRDLLAADPAAVRAPLRQTDTALGTWTASPNIALDPGPLGGFATGASPSGA